MIESELDYQNGNIGKLFRSLFFPTLIGMLSRDIQLKARFHNPKMDCDCRVEARI